jgi:hypothetical protein
VGGHRQTLLGYVLRATLRWTLPAEDLVVDAGDGVRLLCRATWQPGPREARPALVLLHGLCSSDQAGYMLATGRLAFARGFHVIRMNLRGAGDSLPLCPRLYNAGLEADPVAVLHALARVTPRVALAGFSLGANLALLAASRSAARLPAALRAVAAVSPPLDLDACTRALERPDNRVYQLRFVRDLCGAYRRLRRLAPERFPAGRERGLRTLRAYDDAVTAPHAGFRDAAEYYARSSSGPYLHAVGVPTLLLAGLDDPMIPGDSVRRFVEGIGNGLVQAELHATGGHVGFVARSTAPGRFWAAERVLDFCGERLSNGR